MTGLHARFSLTRSDGFLLSVDLDVPAGATLALLGPNGAGKSTFVDAVAGLTSIEAGRISLGERTFDDGTPEGFVPPEARHLGIVFQDYLLFPHLNVLENVTFGTTNFAAADQWLEELGIDDLRERPVADLSGGEAQKVALARALCRDPDLLMLDEPLSALDATSRVDVRRGLADALERFQGPKVLITHDPTEAFLLADVVHVLEDGEVTQAGTPEQIRLRPRTPYAADLAGANLLHAEADSGRLDLGSSALVTADTTVSGPVIVTIHPRAVSIHTHAPDGSPRNVWRARVDRVENYGDRVRLLTAGVVEMTAEVTPAAIESLGIGVGDDVWLSVKATEVHIDPV